MLQKTLIEHENSLNYAQTIQNGLLPKERHFKKLFKDHFVVYKPQDKIGGDFYWLTTKGEITYFALADCTGHGVSGAMLSVLGISLLNYVIQKNFEKVGDYLTELDKKWIETFNNELQDSVFNNDWLEITIISYNHLTKELQYACGGGEFAIVQNNVVTMHNGNKYPIGGWQIEEQRIFDTYYLKLEEKSKLYFFSDGLKHQFDLDNKKKFSRNRLQNILSQISHFKMEDQQEFLEFVFENWKGSTKQTDDVSIIGIEL